MKGVPFLTKVVYKGVRGVTSGRSVLPGINYLCWVIPSSPLPPPPPRSVFPSLREAPTRRAVTTQSSISFGKAFLPVSARVWWKLFRQSWVFTLGHLHNYLLSSAKFWTLSIHPPRALSSWGSYIRTCGSFRQLIMFFFFKQIKSNIVLKIDLQFTINFKKPNAPHQDFLFLRFISGSFFCYHREHESEIHVDLKRLIYHQTTKSS